jgi:hypothetical protein
MSGGASATGATTIGVADMRDHGSSKRWLRQAWVRRAHPQVLPQMLATSLTH